MWSPWPVSVDVPDPPSWAGLAGAPIPEIPGYNLCLSWVHSAFPQVHSAFPRCCSVSWLLFAKGRNIPSNPRSGLGFPLIPWTLSSSLSRLRHLPQRNVAKADTAPKLCFRMWKTMASNESQALGGLAAPVSALTQNIKVT